MDLSWMNKVGKINNRVCRNRIRDSFKNYCPDGIGRAGLLTRTIDNEESEESTTNL